MVASSPKPAPSLLKLLDDDNLVLRLDYSEEEFEWCTDFITMLVWFASMFEEDFVFRGHANAEWNLQPRIGRIKIEGPPKTFRELIRTERRFVDEVRRAQWLSLRDEFSPSEYVDFIAVLQHKGVPTRLIDVTADPLVATYFAALNDDVDGAVISVLRKTTRLASKVAGTDPVTFDGSDPYTIWSPPPVDARMIAQRGEFLLVNGSQPCAMKGAMIFSGIKPRGKVNYKIERIASEYFEHSTRGRRVEQPPNISMFYLPRTYKDQMRKVLASLGLTQRSLFPDIQGYAAMFSV
jgi:hypothetical protein